MDEADVQKYRRLLENDNYINKAVNEIAKGLLNETVELRVLKRCSRCEQYKTEDMFARNKAAKDGRNLWCRACCKEQRHGSNYGLNSSNSDRGRGAP